MARAAIVAGLLMAGLVGGCGKPAGPSCTPLPDAASERAASGMVKLLYCTRSTGYRLAAGDGDARSVAKAVVKACWPKVVAVHDSIAWPPDDEIDTSLVRWVNEMAELSVAEARAGRCWELSSADRR